MSAFSTNTKQLFISLLIFFSDLLYFFDFLWIHILSIFHWDCRKVFSSSYLHVRYLVFHNQIQCFNLSQIYSPFYFELIPISLNLLMRLLTFIILNKFIIRYYLYFLINTFEHFFHFIFVLAALNKIFFIIFMFFFTLTFVLKLVILSKTETFIEIIMSNPKLHQDSCFFYFVNI